MPDKEWIDLILEAKQLGLTIEEIREFLQTENKEEVLRKAE
ncbi:anti-repressor SinI family protein [Virgibacillus profundi]|nr:anti-repressor SinI family protein [Virgibacillus profundi]